MKTRYLNVITYEIISKNFYKKDDFIYDFNAILNIFLFS